MRKLFNLQTTEDQKLSKSYMGAPPQTPKVDKKTDKDLLTESNDTWMGKAETGTMRDTEVQKQIDNMQHPTNYAPSLKTYSPRSAYTHTRT